MARSHWRAKWLSLLGAAAACSGDGTGVRLPPCTSGDPPLSLAAGQYLAIDPAPDSGCAVFPANASGTDSAEYLVVPQSAAAIPGAQSSFALQGAELAAAAVAAQSLMAPAGEPGPAERFHRFLRQGEATRWFSFGPAPAPEAFGPAAAPTAVPSGRKPRVGDTVQFKVFSCLDCRPPKFADVKAVARAVGTHLAIFVDVTAPKPPKGLSDLELEQLKLLFDTQLYGADTAAFGTESDINSDSVVIVLMTPVVNKLVTRKECRETGFVAGFFFGFDLQPGFESDPRSNRAEIFYSIVADPDSALSCPHTRAEVTALIPVTFAHEFQHMISYNQHVLVRSGGAEVLWLNEALSHLAEEIAGRTFPLGDGRRTRFMVGNWFNAYKYLDSTFAHFLLADEGIGSLGERGAQWLFLRYNVDRFAADTSLAESHNVTRALVQTTRTGASNVSFVTSTPFTDLVTRWVVANWVADLPGFAAPAELQYETVALRQLYDSLNRARPDPFQKRFPLEPTQGRGDLVNLRGTLRAGSGMYHRVLQGPGGSGFTLLFSTQTGGPLPATIVPRLNVIRIR